MDVTTKRARFRQLHQSGCFLLPNPWDVGSAKRLEAMGFVALASTSSGSAWALGVEDGQLSRDEVLRHIESLCAATSLPVNADFECGFGNTPLEVFKSVQLAIETGIAGLSIEDYDGSELFSKNEAVERLRAAREAINQSGHEVVLVARSEGFIRNRPDLGETIERIVAFRDAGADCLYTPGVSDLKAMKEIVARVAPAPVNALLLPTLTVSQLEDVGVRRISVGGALARHARAAFEEAAKAFLAQGTLWPKARK
jgi:2-methylisocitrate lyase-like PEP mutase family enzyme